MTVLNMRYFGDPVLKTVADPMKQEQIQDASTRRLVEDMLETMDHYGGVGLAANQIGITRRIFVYDCDGDRGHIINPTWEAVGRKQKPVAKAAFPSRTSTGMSPAHCACACAAPPWMEKKSTARSLT